MASSQVEFSSSSSPFGCVPRRDHKRRDSNVTATHVARFRNNLKTLVMDRFNDCISITTPLSTIDTRNDAQTNNHKLGASSLVQIWEKRLNKQVAMETETENDHEQEQEQEQERACSVEAGDFEDDAGPGSSEDGFADWHSSSSPPASTQSQAAAVASTPAPAAAAAAAGGGGDQSDKVRVVDIIRRLALTAAKPPSSSSSSSSCFDDSNNSNESSSSNSALILRHQVDPKCLSYILCSPRIRGRQAFADLLFQIQRDRQKELHTLQNRRLVSKFPQRGRIQSLLRLKILKRGMALEDEQQRPKFVITPRENHRSSTIMHLRERFSGVGENGTARSPSNDDDDDVIKTQLDIDTNDNDDNNNNDNNNKDNDNQQVVDDAAIHSSVDSTIQDSPIAGDVEEKIIEEQGGDQELDTPTDVEARWEDTPNLNLDSQDPIIGWEDSTEAPEETYEGTSYDWFTDISRPRIYWENRRQTWYQQMLDSNSANDEICALIKRKTVSNFLSSEFRERIDKLMVSRLERRTQEEEGEGEEEEDDEVNEAEEEEEEEEELWCFSEGRESSQPKSSSDNEDDDEEDERRSLISGQYHEARSGYLDQSASPSILSSWSYQDNEMGAGEDSNRGAASASSPQPIPTFPVADQFSSNNIQHSNSLVSTTSSPQPSIEMELIYDLRGQMEQMYREMLELRKSIKCCMDMQRQSKNHEPVAGSGRGVGGRKSNNYKEKSRKQRKCCICHNTQIDSLLYRCGHMCSCMKCGKELQWGGGKCPVCKAPIDDVVPVRPSFIGI